MSIEVVVGRIGKPHGLRGEVTVDVRTDEPERRFADGATLRAEPPAGPAGPLAPHRGRHPLAPGRAAGPLRGARRPQRRRGGPRHRAARHDRPGRAARRTPRSSTTTSWSGSTCVDDGRHAARQRRRPSCTAARRTCCRSAPPTAARRWCRSSTALVPEVDVRRRPGRRRRPARAGHALPGRRRAGRRVNSTSSRSSPTTSRRSSSRCRARPATRGCSTCTSTTCATGPTTGTAPSTTRPTAAAPGMVMKPEPWGEALDALAPAGATVVVPTPAGEPFTPGAGRRAGDVERTWCSPAVATRASTSGWSTHAADPGRCREISLGDYVLNGGEVAALAIIEAVVRLLPGFMGNAESLVEESHEDGLLEYPVYTKPASWRGPTCPTVLLSGDHAAIAAWRREQAATPHGRAPPRPAAARRVASAPSWPTSTCARRVAAPTPASCSTLQRACWVQERAGQPRRRHPGAARVARRRAAVGWGSGPPWSPASRRPGGWSGPCAAAVDRPRRWDVGRVMVAPDLQGRGLRRALARARGGRAPRRGDDVRRCFTGAGGDRQPADVQEGGVPAADRPGGASGRSSVLRPSDVRTTDFTLTPALWQTSPLVRSEARSPDASSMHHAGSRRTAPATGGAPAGLTGTAEPSPPRSAADLWHSRGASS